MSDDTSAVLGMVLVAGFCSVVWFCVGLVVGLFIG